MASNVLRAELELLNLPTDLLKMIVEEAELKEQLVLRKVSRSLRALVDGVRPNFQELEIRAELDRMILTYGETEIEYAEAPRLGACPEGTSRFYVNNKDYREMFFEDLKVSLKNPMLKLMLLKISYGVDSDDRTQNSSKFFDDVGCLLKSIDNGCNVQCLDIKMSHQDDAVSILSNLKPGVLQIIALSTHRGDSPTQCLPIDKLTQTDQWKRAGVAYIFKFQIEEPMESFYHFRFFFASWIRVTPNMLNCLRDALSKSTNFEQCTILGKERINVLELIMGPEKTDDDTLIEILYSTDLLETLPCSFCITIEKKSRD